MISKQDNMVHLAGLDLQHCSETIEIVSISGNYCLNQEGHISKANSQMIVQVQKENAEIKLVMSLIQIFFWIK